MVTSNGGPAPRESWPPRSTDRSPWARRDPRRGAHGPGLLRRFDLGALSALDTLSGKGQDPSGNPGLARPRLHPSTAELAPLLWHRVLLLSSR